MKKKYFWFSFILVAFVLTAHSTWAFFKDQKIVETAFQSSVTSTNKTQLTIEDPKTFDPDHGKTTIKVTFHKDSTLKWNYNSVHLTIGTPYIVDNTNQQLGNLFGENNSGENSYYKISGLDKPTEISETKAVFDVVVDYSKDYSKDLQIRLGVHEIRFDITGVAESVGGKPITVHDNDDWLKIATLPWDWPTNARFNQIVYRVTGYNYAKQTVTSRKDLNFYELHTPVYYGPSYIESDPQTNQAYSKNVFPSLRFIPDSIEFFENNQLSYKKQFEKAKEYFPEAVCYGEDKNYFLIRGPIYYLPGKGFIGLYYMTWYGPYNDYGANNKVFKPLYIYNNEYKAIKYVGHHEYQLEPINSYLAQYTDRFVTMTKINNENVLIAKYQDYSDLRIGSAENIRPKFNIHDEVYRGPDYVHVGLGTITLINEWWDKSVSLYDEKNELIYSNVRK